MKRITGFLIGFVAWFVFAHLFGAFVDLRWWWFTEWSAKTRAINLMYALCAGAWASFLVPRWLEKVKAR